MFRPLIALLLLTALSNCRTAPVTQFYKGGGSYMLFIKPFKLSPYLKESSLDKSSQSSMTVDFTYTIGSQSSAHVDFKFSIFAPLKFHPLESVTIKLVDQDTTFNPKELLFIEPQKGRTCTRYRCELQSGTFQKLLNSPECCIKVQLAPQKYITFINKGKWKNSIAPHVKGSM